MLQMTREGYIIYQHIEFYQIPLKMIFSTEIGGGCASRLVQNYIISGELGRFGQSNWAIIGKSKG